MDIEYQLSLATEAGMVEDYKHHLGMVENPLPFGLFITKKALLDSHLAADPDGKDEWRDSKIYQLSTELGY